MGRRAAFHNLGCRVNSYETEAMKEQLKTGGYEIVPFEPGADVYVINTCTVTNIADRKSRQMLHRAREMNPEAVVVAAGCYAEKETGSRKKDPVIDLVVGNREKSKLLQLLEDYFENRTAVSCRESVRTAKAYEELTVSGAEERTRAFIKIQDGCNQFCSYCMIPYVRGRVRSRKADAVIAEAERLAAAGFREIVLTGIHISSYGLDFTFPGENRQTPDASEEETNVMLLDLLRRIAEIPVVRRIRMGSLEPGIMTEEFVRGMASVSKICPQFHLSLQSGCDETLERMKRKYRTADYRRICERIRRCYDHPAITTDVIAGFPGETDGEFRKSADFVREMQFAKMHVFKYSKRDGTKAAVMPGQVPEEIKKERSRLLMEIDRDAHKAYASFYVGKPVEVLFEEAKQIRGTRCMSGHTEVFLEAHAADEIPSGAIVKCMAEAVCPDGSLSVKTVENEKH